MANQAAFTINGTPSSDPATGNRKFVALNSQTLSVTLEQSPSQALSAKFEVYDVSNSDSPFASKGAPAITWNENGAAAIIVGPPPFGINSTVTIDMPGAGTPPATGIYSYLIRCTVSTAGDGSPGSQVQVFERLVVILSLSTTPQLRKTVPGETTEADSRAWSDALNDMVDAMENITVGATTVFTLTSAAGQFAVPSGVTVGDLVYATGADAADLADNSAVSSMPCFGIVIAKPTATTATLAFMGLVAGLSGMTPGLEQYVGTTGARVEAGSLPSALGSVIQQVGIAISPTTMILAPQAVVVL